ncbi:hypothetical protein ACSS6W_007374 [Trichoderma asperelloides]
MASRSGYSYECGTLPETWRLHSAGTCSSRPDVSRATKEWNGLRGGSRPDKNMSRLGIGTSYAMSHKRSQ